MSITEEIERSRGPRSLVMYQSLAEMRRFQKHIADCYRSEMAAQIVTEYPEVRYMTVTAYEAWSQMTVEIEDIFGVDGEPLEDQSEIRQWLEDYLDDSVCIQNLIPYSGQKLDLHEMGRCVPTLMDH